MLGLSDCCIMGLGSLLGLANQPRLGNLNVIQPLFNPNQAPPDRVTSQMQVGASTCGEGVHQRCPGGSVWAEEGRGIKPVV